MAASSSRSSRRTPRTRVAVGALMSCADGPATAMRTCRVALYRYAWTACRRAVFRYPTSSIVRRGGARSIAASASGPRPAPPRAAGRPGRSGTRRATAASSVGDRGDRQPGAERVDEGLVVAVLTWRRADSPAPLSRARRRAARARPRGRCGSELREVVAADRGHQRAERGDAERPADHARHRQRARRDAGLRRDRRRSSPPCSSATSSKPMPTPSSMNADSRKPKLVSTWMRDCQASAAVTSSRPMTSGMRGPMRSREAARRAARRP